MEGVGKESEANAPLEFFEKCRPVGYEQYAARNELVS